MTYFRKDRKHASVYCTLSSDSAQTKISFFVSIFVSAQGAPKFPYTMCAMQSLLIKVNHRRLSGAKFINIWSLAFIYLSFATFILGHLESCRLDRSALLKRWQQFFLVASSNVPGDRRPVLPVSSQFGLQL